MKFLVSIASLLLCGMQSIFAISCNDILINEIMISNIDGVMKNYEYPDSWVELYNNTQKTISLKGLKLTNGEMSYSFGDSQTISANGYLTVYCDKRKVGNQASFCLNPNGGELYLKNENNVIDYLKYPAMIAPQIGYGREPDNRDSWEWEVKPTPGQPNQGTFTSVLLPEPTFSLKGRIMRESSQVDISFPQNACPEDTKIYVTFDGTEPNKESQSAKSFSFALDTTTIIRAKLMSEHALSPRSTCQSYIFHPRETSIPIISIVTDGAYFYDSKIGIFSDNKTVDGKANYKQDWRRPVSIEYLDSNPNGIHINQIGETAVFGAGSRKSPQKSLKLISNQRFGKKHFNGVLWEDKSHIDEVKSFVIRNGGSNRGLCRIADAFIQKLYGTHIGNLDWQAYSPVIAYINGEYVGIFGLRERTNDDFVWANYQGEENIERVTNLRSPECESFKRIKELCKQSSSQYADFEQLIDVEEWINYLCLQIFSSNTDWPYNNVSLWRKKDGGKWRWITKDIDYVGRVFRSELMDDALTFNYFQYLTYSGKDGSQEYRSAQYCSQSLYLFEKLFSLPEFNEQLIDRLSVYLGDFLKAGVSSTLLWEMHDEIYTETDITFRKYFSEKGKIFTNATKSLDRFLQSRPRQVYEHMSKYYGLGNVIPMTIITHSNRVKVNDVDLTEGDFVGAYFSDRVLRLTSIASNLGWKMELYERMGDGQMVKKTSDKIWTQQTVNLKLKDYTSCDSVAFSLFTIDESEFESRLNELSITSKNLKDWSNYSSINLSEPECAYVNITGVDHLPVSKYDNLHAWMDFYDAQGNYFQKKILLNLQGGGDANKEKKNLSLSFCEDEWLGEETTNIAFGEWVLQDEFHLKAFYNDYFRGTAAIGYKLYNQMTLSLGHNAYPWQRGLTEVDRINPELNIYDQARCVPDAFPCVVYLNGSYYGTYAWQLKKQRKNMNLTKNMPTHIHLDGTLNDNQLFGGEVNWTKFEIRNPKNLYLMDGSDYDGDHPGEILDATSKVYEGKKKQVRCAEVKEYIKALSGYYREISSLENEGKNSADIKKAIEQRFDITSMVDYMVFSLATSNYNGFSKNWQWFTYDGQKWFVAPYDLDLIFGYNEDAEVLWPASQSSKKYDYRMLNVDENGPMRWVKAYYWDKVRERWNQLRDNGIFSVENIMSIVNDWYNRLTDVNREEEWRHWPESPCLVNYVDSQQRIRQWIDERLRLEDAYLNGEGIQYELVLTEAEWATLCVGFAFDIPQGLEVYTVDDLQADGMTLNLTPVTAPKDNLPYLVHGKAGVYYLRGEEFVSTQKHDNGLLTGTMTDIYAPIGSYVLQQQDGRLAFYYVDNSIAIPAHHAYLSGQSQSMSAYLRLPDDGMAIENLTQDAPPSAPTYSIWGYRIIGDSYGISAKDGKVMIRQ